MEIDNTLINYGDKDIIMEIDNILINYGDKDIIMEIDNILINYGDNDNKSIQDYKKELDNIVYTLGSEALSYEDDTQARFIGIVKDINIENKTITINDLSGDVSFAISKNHTKEMCEDFDIFKPIVIHAKVRNLNGLLKLFVMKLLTIDETRKGYQR